MLVALAAFIYRRRWETLVGSALFLALSIAVIIRGGRLTGGSFGDREAEKTQVLVEQVLGHSTDTTFVAIFHSETLDPRDEAFRVAMSEALAPLADDPDVIGVVTPDRAPLELAPEMVSPRAKSAVAMVSLRGDFKEALSRYPAVRARLRSPEIPPRFLQSPSP